MLPSIISGFSGFVRINPCLVIFLHAKIAFDLSKYLVGCIRHNEELHNLYPSPSIIRMIKSRRMKWAGNVARMVKRNAYRMLVGKPEGKEPLGRPRRRWEDNIKMDLR
jgi:hypothetical protein